MHDLTLEGCKPEPLAHYLKALGVLRLVSEQSDENARGAWRGDRFELSSTLDREALRSFLLDAYRPTPIIAPWNGGSGFYPKDKKDGIDAIRAGTSERFKPYRDAIGVAFDVLDAMGIDDKVDKSDKEMLLENCRANLPDGALTWLDAAFVLTDDGAKYPPLLGTGGNDGRLEFSNNFMQRLVEVIRPDSGQPTEISGKWLDAAVFDETSHGFGSHAIGQFLPSAAGGANAAAGFNGNAVVNPWDFVLMFEGAIVFAAACTKRLEPSQPGVLAYPFTVRPSGAGSGAVTADDESTARAELWVPLWSRASRYIEIDAVFSEGRASLGRRRARNGIDFARAVAGLGVDRGISEFQRYGFHVRNGLSYFATPLNRFVVRRRPETELIDEIDEWLDGFRRRATADTAPSSVRRASTRLDDAIMRLCEHGSPTRVEDVFVELGKCEEAMARSFSWVTDPKVRLTPVPLLSTQWLDKLSDHSVEFRLAISLASLWGRYQRDAGQPERSVSLRENLEPVRVYRTGGRMRPRWAETQGRDVVSLHRLVEGMSAILSRRLLWSQTRGGRYDDGTRYTPRLSDIADFIEGRVDEGRLLRLLWACNLIDWPKASNEGWKPDSAPTPHSSSPPAIFSVLKLCFPGHPDYGPHGVRTVPAIHQLARGGDGLRASRLAVRRLRASDVPVALDEVYARGTPVRRTAAALLFPLSAGQLRQLAIRLEPPGTRQTRSHESPSI